MKPQKLIETMKKKIAKRKEETTQEEDIYIPNSITYTKLELPIHYSNLIYIEDMQIENSTYFITGNGFISKKIKLSSSKHDPNFNMSNCVFRIYPKTYNVNKDKVKEYIDRKSKSLGDELQELHYKFSAEMFNNLDIIQNKFGEPVRYGDIIILLHENSRMFIEFVPSSKTLRLSNNDSDATLFLIEPAKEIMLNDNHILKTGQPLKLKIAGFSYSEKSLYFGLRFPYMNNNVFFRSLTNDRGEILSTLQNYYNNTKNKNTEGSITNLKKDKDKAYEDIQLVEEDEENKIDANEILEHFEGKLYDEKIKKYLQQPEIIVEETTSSKWRFLLYTTFTTNENLIIYGDYVQLFHSNTNSVLGVKINDSPIVTEEKLSSKFVTFNNQPPEEIQEIPQVSQGSKDYDGKADYENENILTIIDQSVSQIDNDEDLLNLPTSMQSTFKLIEHSLFSHKQDVDATWVLVNIFPTIKHQSFIRYYEQNKIDTYHMIFRIKNFKTKQILTIQQNKDNASSDDLLLGTKKGKQIEGLLDGCEVNHGKVYKFGLIDDIQSRRVAEDSDILSEDYQYSLFGFRKSMKALSYYSARPEKNDFLYLYHVVTKSYLAVIPGPNGSCHLSLVKYPDEREVFKICPVSTKSQWEYRFLGNLFNLLNYVTTNLAKIKDSTSAQTKTIVTKILTTTHFILDNLSKFTMNLFINKFVYDSGYNSVVKSRQLLISNFGFTKILLKNFIYNYWISNNMEEIHKLNELLAIQKSKRYYSLTQANEITFAMFTYTQAIFDFLIFYCKDNEEIKNELYVDLHVYFYFVNLIESCLYGMIEIFKNNEKILISLIRDCNQNEKFRTTLQMLSSTYFSGKHINNSHYSIIDLIFDYIEISKYDNDEKNNINKENSLNSKAFSLLSREKYYELLKALVNNQNGTNILENQREIINKIIMKKKDNSDAYIFKEAIYSKRGNTPEEANLLQEDNDIPPCLKELLHAIAYQNPDEKIHFFIQTHEQFAIEKLFPSKKKKADEETLAANIKWIMYFFPASDHLTAILDPEETKKTEQFATFLKAFYDNVIIQLKFMENTIDYSNKSQVNLINSFLHLLKKIFEKNTVMDSHQISFKNVTGILLSYLTRKYQRISLNDKQNISNLIHGEMNEKKIILKQRIIKSEHSQYISIAESWLNIYLVFKFFLLKQLEDSSLDNNDYANMKREFNETNPDNMNTNTHINDKDCVTLREEELGNSATKINNIPQFGLEKKQQNKTEITFYTKDELMDFNKNYKTMTGFEETLKGINQLDFTQTKNKSLFHELHNAANKSQIRRNLSEDEKMNNIYEVSKNIINILKLTIKQNVAILNDNFYNYYNSLTYKPGQKYELKHFIEHCVPNMDSCVIKLNTLIKTYQEPKLNSKFKCYNQLTNLNSVFEERGESNMNLNFIQNLINVFNLSEDLEMQESLLDLIYVFFTQRCKFFDSVVMFNEHLSDFCNIKYNPFNNKEKIKSQFKKFYYSYEKKKQEYQVKTIDFFMTYLLNELINIYKKILKYWKNEFRILSLAYSTKYCQNMEVNELMITKIEKVLQMILEQKNVISRPIFDRNAYLDFIDVFISVMYFIRNNADNPLFNSLITILNEDGGMFNKMYFSLINDFIEKGKQLSQWYSKKQFMFFDVVHEENSAMKDYTQQEIFSLKNKYYSALLMLITLQTITLPKNQKTNNYFQNLLNTEKELFRYDSFSSFLILLSISDLQKGSLTLKYFSIMEKVNELNKNNCEENSISPKEPFPNCFVRLYVDIMINVLRFIILKDTMINEINLDEIVVDNFIYLLKKILFNEETKGKLKLAYIKLVNYFHEIGSLSKVYQTKTRQDMLMNKNEIPSYSFFPTPLELYPLMRKQFDKINMDQYDMKESEDNKKGKENEWRKKQIVYVKRTFSLFKYIMFYCFEVDPKYFECTELFDNQKEPYEWIKTLVKCVIVGNKSGDNLICFKDILQPDQRAKTVIRYPGFPLKIPSKAGMINSPVKNESNHQSQNSHSNDNKSNDNLDNGSNNNKKEENKEIDLNRQEDGHAHNNPSTNNALNPPTFNAQTIEVNPLLQNLQIQQSQVNQNSEFAIFVNTSLFYLFHCYTFKQLEKNKDIAELTSNLFQGESIIPQQIEQMDFFALKNYVCTTITSDEMNKNYTNDEKEKDMNLFYSTGTDNAVCLYIFNKLTRYDENPDSASIYRRLYDNLNLKSKKDKNEKMYAFKSMLWKNSDELYDYADNETNSIIFYLLILLDAETTMQYDEIFLTFINKIAEYISIGFSRTITRKRVKLTCFLLNIIIKILKFYDDNEDLLITETIRKKTLREAQIMFLRTGIIEKCLSLVCRYNTPEIKPILPYIFEMFSNILKKGNYNSQEAFYSLFTTKGKFEPVFSFMLDVISKQINHILSNKAFIIRHRKKQLSFEKKLSLRSSFNTKLDSKILQFLQLLCENHNKKLQIYLHSQENFRKSYDLVSQTQNYLTIIANNFEPFLFESLTKCFDLLIEFVQGPCIENQIALINSKVLITLHDILNCYTNCETKALDDEFPERIDKVKDLDGTEINSKIFQTNLMKMTTQQISLLTFKSSILLHALIENRTKDDNIYFTIKSVVKEETVKEVFKKIFFEHLLQVTKSNDLDDYRVKLSQFNCAQDVDEAAKSGSGKVKKSFVEKTDVQDYLIIETGFLLYFLYMYYQDYDIHMEQMVRQTKQKMFVTQIYDSLNGTFFELFVSLYLFFYHFCLSILKTVTYVISGCIFIFSFGKLRIFNLMRRMFKHQTYGEEHCNKFYDKYTESIEILRDGVVYRIYFYVLPFCKSLNRFEKTRFLEEIDRTNAKTKLTEIIKFADNKKYELEFDYKIKEYSTYIPFFGTIFNSVELWKDFSLILNIVQNFFNIFAVYKVGRTINLCLAPGDCAQLTYWNDEKSFFYMTKEDFLKVIRTLSYIQCALAILIFVEFICRTMPAIYKSSKEIVNRRNYTPSMRHAGIVGHFLKNSLINFEVIYYCCYLIFAFLGTFNSDFFFAFLLLEIIQRFKTLRNVLKAIKNPYKQLFLTFCLWIIVIYFFAIFGYTFFRDDFVNFGDCSSLVRCVAVIFYENNKMDNGIGGYLNPIYEMEDKTSKWVGRFFYDELFNLLLKILVIQMISGIIIDNFALLRVQEMDMLSDMENLCTICGLKREDIEKIYEKDGKTYQDHLKDHRIFNYIFYIIYLYQKDKTEYTGVESYIYELAYNQKDITWFPIDHLYIAKPGELEMENEEDSDD